MIERQPRSSIADLDARPTNADAQGPPVPDGKSAEKTAKTARRVFEDCQDADKMLLRWVRASLTLMGTGVGVDRALAYLASSAPTLDPLHILRLAGQLLALIGMAALWIACYQHWQTVKRIRADQPLPMFQVPLALSVGLAVSALGVIALVSVLAYR